MSDTKNRWSKEEFLAHVERKRQMEIEDSHRVHEARKARRKRARVMLVIILILLLIDRFLFDIDGAIRELGWG